MADAPAALWPRGEVERQTVAGGGLLHRRVLLRQGLVLASAAATSASLAQAAPPGAPASASGPETSPGSEAERPAWMRTPGQPFSNYGQPSPYERQVIRRIGANRLVPGNGVSWTPLEDLEGFITPSGLHFERHHNGVPLIDPAKHELTIHGRVRQPLRFGVDALLRYPMRSRLVFIECGGNSNAGWHPEPIQRPVGSFHGMVSCNEWTGVPLRTFLERVGADTKAKYVAFKTADDYPSSIDMATALHPQTILATQYAGETLADPFGYPLRLRMSTKLGYKNPKWITAIEVTNTYPGGYWEKLGFNWHGGI